MGELSAASALDSQRLGSGGMESSQEIPAALQESWD